MSASSLGEMVGVLSDRVVETLVYQKLRVKAPCQCKNISAKQSS